MIKPKVRICSRFSKISKPYFSYEYCLDSVVSSFIKLFEEERREQKENYTKVFDIILAQKLKRFQQDSIVSFFFYKADYNSTF